MMIETPAVKKQKEKIMTPQRKQLILNLVDEYWRVHQYGPSFDDIAKGSGYAESAAGTAHTLVQELITEGWLIGTPKVARSIRLAPQPPAPVYCEISDPDLKRIAKQQRNLRILRRL